MLRFYINKLLFPLSFSPVIGLETDVLFRIFLLIPYQTYQTIYGLSVETLKLVWVTGSFITPIKVAISTLLTVVLGNRLLKILGTRIITE